MYVNNVYKFAIGFALRIILYSISNCALKFNHIYANTVYIFTVLFNYPKYEMMREEMRFGWVELSWEREGICNLVNVYKRTFWTRANFVAFYF